MTFRKAVQQVPSIARAYRKGLRALREADRKRIRCDKTRILAGSIDLDSAVRDLFHDEPRWDYGIGLRKSSSSDEAIWVEVHPASSHHVDEMLQKLEWLKRWLSNEATLPSEISKRFVWVASGSIALTKGSPQRKRIAAAGLAFGGRNFHVC
jgi:hypothetical protein